MTTRSARYLRRSKKLTPEEKKKAELTGENTVSIEDQRKRTIALEKANEYEPVDREFMDDGKSAWREDVERPAFEDLCRWINQGLVDVVVADRPDRLSRRGGEAYLAFRRLCRENNVVIHTVSHGLDDTADKVAEMPAYLASWVANSESENKSRNLRNAAKERAKRGERRNAGPTPFGWSKENRLVVDEAQAKLLRAAAERVLKGGSVAGIVREWNDKGIPTSWGSTHWSPSSVKSVLTRPSNAGLSVYKRKLVLHEDTKEPVLGNWEPIWKFDDDEENKQAIEYHDRLVAMIGSGGGSGREPRSAVLSGVIRCHCGMPMRATNAGKGMKVYRCTVQLERRPKGGLEHVTIKRETQSRTDGKKPEEGADDRVIWETLHGLMSAPLDALPSDVDSVSLSALYAAKVENTAQQQRIKDGFKAGIYDEREAASELTTLRAEHERIEQEIAEVVKRNARASIIFDLRRDLFEVDEGRRKVELGDVHARYKELRKRFDCMSVEDRQALIRSTVEVTVYPGRGTKRLKVRHLLATHLNGDKIRLPEGVSRDDALRLYEAAYPEA